MAGNRDVRMATRLLSYAKKSAVTFAVTTTTPSTRSYYPSRTAVQIPDPPLLSRVCPSGTSPPGQVQCVCGDEASGKSTVECVSCSSWSHIQCARLTLRTAKQSRFLCHKCRPATGKRAGAAGGKKGQGDTAHLLAPPRPSLQSSSNELPAPATSPPTCSSTPAQYSPLSPHQPSPPPPPPNHPHHHPLSHPQRNILSLPHHHPLTPPRHPPNPPWKHPPRWPLRLTLKLKTCSLNLPLSLTIAPTSQMFTGFLNTRASRLLLPPLPPPAITPCLHPLPATVHHHCVLCCYNHLSLNTRTPTRRLVHLHPKPSPVSPPGQCSTVH